ncbi:MAG: hypothetical protein JNL69_10445 [Bacteroidia bacterium]|nr:hypothetical protein [Bacteroidia bacterium]
MKKKRFILAILFCLGGVNAYSQKKLGESTITVGGGISLIGTASSITANGNSRNDEFRSIPFLVASYDVGLSELLSLGASYSRQEYRYYYDYYDVQYSLFINRETDRYVRENYGLRVLFHFGKKETLDMYAGVRLGLTVWNINSTNPNNEYKPENNSDTPWSLRVNVKNTHYTAQALYGFRYYFSKNVGLNFEVGIGPPGLIMLGLNIRY